MRTTAGRFVPVTAAVALALGATACSGTPSSTPASRATASSTTASSTTPSSTTPSSTSLPMATGTVAPGAQPLQVPRLRVETVTDRLEHGWDVGFLPEGKVLVTQRPGRFALLSSSSPGAALTQVRADTTDVFAHGEGGLLGMVVHPDFATTREFTTCLDHQEAGRPVDIRLVTWRLSPDGSSAQRVRTLLTGLPIAVNGRHSGCRPATGPGGYLYVGTGDTARGDVPQDRTALGGKVLRLDLRTGAPAPGNPFLSAPDPRERYVWTYGHRNVQGVAWRPGTDQVFDAEHGPTFDDEVNLLRAGGNYGWDPSRGGSTGGYDETVPMTDRQRFPDAVDAVWESGPTTQAVCAATFLTGKQWGPLDGALVVTALKGAKALVMLLDDAGGVRRIGLPAELQDAFGRLRAARQGPDGALYLTTSNGQRDRLLRVTLA